MLEPGRDAHGQVTHAIVLIQADRSAIKTLGGALADVEGVAEAYSVTGEWDFVAMLRVRDPAEVAEVVTQRFAELEGIKNTQTLVAFEVFSQHDLEALFSIGNCARSGLVLPAPGEPERAVLPVVRHQHAARGDRERADAGEQRAGRAVVAALPADPEPPELAVVVEGLSDELW